MITIPIEIGDTILVGRFKNKRVIVKTIGIDEHGSPTVNGRSILNCRIVKKEEMKLTEQDKKKLKAFTKRLIESNNANAIKSWKLFCNKAQDDFDKEIERYTTMSTAGLTNDQARTYDKEKMELFEKLLVKAQRQLNEFLTTVNDLAHTV